MPRETTWDSFDDVTEGRGRMSLCEKKTRQPVVEQRQLAQAQGHSSYARWTLHILFWERQMKLMPTVTDRGIRKWNGPYGACCRIPPYVLPFQVRFPLPGHTTKLSR